MPKTRDAFALRIFDDKKILQRPLFKFVKIGDEYFLKENLRDDVEILKSLSATDDVNKNEKNLKKLKAIYEKLVYYQAKLIDKIHLPRLVRFKRASKNPELRKRAENLLEEYDNDAMQITMTSELFEHEIEKLEKFIQEQNRKIFSQRLKQARKNLGFTQKQLAEKIGKTQNAINLYESGQREPPLTVLIRLSRALNQSTDKLLGIST